MKEKNITISYSEYDSEAELNNPERNLLQSAKDALSHSYSPYSRFKVGSAVLMKSGKVVLGSNQENASFPAGVCAERAAVYNAKHQDGGIILSVAITVKSADFEVPAPVAPCGICRQVLLECEMQQEQNIQIIIQGSKGKVYTLSSVKDLLPIYFFEKELKKE